MSSSKGRTAASGPGDERQWAVSRFVAVSCSEIRGPRSVFLANQVLGPRILVKVVPRRGVRSLTKDLGPSAIIATTISSQPTITTQVPCFGTPIGITVQGPWSTDHRQGLLWQFAMAEIEGHGLGTPDHGPRALVTGPLVLEWWIHWVGVLFGCLCLG
jgi:hypothetical protein